MARRSSSSWLVGTLSVGVIGIIAMVFRPRAAQASAKSSPPPPPMPLIDDEQWQRAKLTEYYPDLPETATATEKRLEGGANARHELIPVITLDQHRSDPLKYPFATVSADVKLQGKTLKVGFGPRVYFAAYPNDVFRIYDTGSHFTGIKKAMLSGVEPFDIAVSYFGLRTTIGDRLTLYRVDWEDVLAFPQRLKRTRIA